MRYSLKRRKSKEDFIYSHYEKYCISNIPHTILKIFDINPKGKAIPLNLCNKNKLEIENVEKIALFLLDGVSYAQWKTFCKKYSFFNTVSRNGILMPLTSLFPSATAPTITTINTGLTPQEHSILE